MLDLGASHLAVITLISKVASELVFGTSLTSLPKKNAARVPAVSRRMR